MKPQKKPAELLPFVGHTPHRLHIQLVFVEISSTLPETSNYMDVSKNNGTPKSPILIVVFHDFHHPFWGFSLYF